MSFPEALLQLAIQLAEADSQDVGQARLRRAVSTAYYALFHLLISEATLNWNRPESRSRLGRAFEHGVMKTASHNLAKRIANNPEAASLAHLKAVAETFVMAHQKRVDADYDLAIEWTRTEVLNMLDSVSRAFASWKTIREEPEAQDYLLSLLLRQKGVDQASFAPRSLRSSRRTKRWQRVSSSQ